MQWGARGILNIQELQSVVAPWLQQKKTRHSKITYFTICKDRGMKVVLHSVDIGIHVFATPSLASFHNPLVFLV
jgi:hypothetical protein